MDTSHPHSLFLRKKKKRKKKRVLQARLLTNQCSFAINSVGGWWGGDEPLQTERLYCFTLYTGSLHALEPTGSYCQAFVLVSPVTPCRSFVCLMLKPRAPVSALALLFEHGPREVQSFQQCGELSVKAPIHESFQPCG